MRLCDADKMAASLFRSFERSFVISKQTIKQQREGQAAALPSTFLCLALLLECVLRTITNEMSISNVRMFERDSSFHNPFLKLKINAYCSFNNSKLVKPA